jgi:multidrug efflux pump subunit AcrA (membrane-fusion protein)
MTCTPRPLWNALLTASLLAACPAGCSKSSTGTEQSADTPPPAPAFDGWVVKTDVVVPSGKRTEVESRLEGKIKALRNVVYEVQGKKVQINVIVAQDTNEADKIFRILANKKPAWAYVRKGDVLYEFVGQNESMPDIQKAHDQLSAR